jgi:hypothetical protein
MLLTCYGPQIGASHLSRRSRLTIVTIYATSLIEGAFPEGMPEKRSGGRCLRADLPSAPGRLWATARPA